jgi:hypothetical protein
MCRGKWAGLNCAVLFRRFHPGTRRKSLASRAKIPEESAVQVDPFCLRNKYLPYFFFHAALMILMR